MKRRERPSWQREHEKLSVMQKEGIFREERVSWGEAQGREVGHETEEVHSSQRERTLPVTSETVNFIL